MESESCKYQYDCLKCITLKQKANSLIQTMFKFVQRAKKNNEFVCAKSQKIG